MFWINWHINNLWVGTNLIALMIDYYAFFYLDNFTHFTDSFEVKI